MKNLLLIIVGMLLFIGVASAQSPMLSPYGNVTDTVTNTATESLSLVSKGFTNSVGVQLVVTKQTGTVGGTAILQGSLDGINYYRITQDSLALSNVASQNKLWQVTGVPPVLYYRVSVTGAGTMAATISAKLLARTEKR